MSIQTIKNILKVAAEERWPYPKTFKALKAAGLQRYEVKFNNAYLAKFSGAFGTFLENNLEGYTALKAADQFCADGIKHAVIKHITEKTHYLDFLADVAKNGASHYKVDMKARTVTYLNANEMGFYQEYVPQVSEIID